jgi:hypothetical protein
MRVDGGMVLQSKARKHDARIGLGCLLSISRTTSSGFFRVGSCLYLLISI